MSFSQSVARAGGWITVLALGVFAVPSFAQTRPAPRPSSAALIDAAHPFMQAEEVALKGDTVVFGDPLKIGPYVLRSKLNANQKNRSENKANGK